MLADFRGNLLLILDCCFAAQAARAAPGDREVPLNVELLAACAMNEKTPLANYHSFTAAFIKALRFHLKEKNSSVTISQIFDDLSSRKAELNATPYRQGIGHEATSIRLRHLAEKPKSLAARIPRTAIHLSVLLDDELDDSILHELVEYLKKDAPTVVCGVECSSIARFVGAANEYMTKPEKGAPPPTQYRGLQERSRSLVGASWSDCLSHLIHLVSFLKTKSDRTSAGASISATIAQKETLVVRRLQNAMSSFKQDLALALLSSTAIMPESSPLLYKAAEDASLTELGVSEVLKLRLLHDDLKRAPLEIQTTHIFTPSIAASSSYSPNLMLETRGDQIPILVEYKYYDGREAHNQHNQKVETGRVATLTALLGAAVSEEYLSLRCTGSFPDHKNHRYGLSFELPAGRMTRPYSLRELLLAPEKYGRPGLKERLDIARKLGDAILKWHTSGWLHQGIASHNVIFFFNPESSKIDFSKPYLCGFEYTRQSYRISAVKSKQDFYFDVYRHPTRQGLPTIRHHPEHDLYALGVVLLDIGLWHPVEMLFPEIDKDLPQLNAVKVSERILKNVPRLDFYVGSKYTEAVRKCIEGQWEWKDDPLRIIEEFKVSALNKLHDSLNL